MRLPTFRLLFLFYADTNILDWGSTNKIAVSLQHLAFIWDAETKECVQVEVKTANTENFYVSSLSWNPEGNMVGIADNNGDVMVSTFNL